MSIRTYVHVMNTYVQYTGIMYMYIYMYYDFGCYNNNCVCAYSLILRYDSFKYGPVACISFGFNPKAARHM